MSGAANVHAGQNGAAPLIELRSVTKRYGRHLALRNVSFRVNPGEVVGLLGDNGAGKSTLIKMLSGINPPNSGEVLSDGRPASLKSRTESEALGIETIYQDIALVDGMDIMRNVFLGREFTNSLGFLRKAKMRQVAADVLKNSVDISGIRSPNQLVGDLSGGQKQAVAIARAVYFKKRLLLLDEPTSALSVRETNKVLEMVGSIKQSGTSAVFVTHNIYHAYEVCDRFVVMSHGTVEREISKEGTSVAELTTAVINS